MLGKIKIREAVPSDLTFVEDLMDTALSPYYGGDHKAHAKRIFSTHLSGGVDTLGFFSTEQKMFILEVNEKSAGILHLVGKKQGTYKISPLIVAPEFQSEKGLGSQLLKHAEAYAEAHGARQLYCTVAMTNRHALNFFLKQGFTPAGQSHSHYKDGITETMLYKLLSSKERDNEIDYPNITVSAAEPEHYEQIRALLLSNLPTHFKDIDEKWVDALFDGYSRLHTGDINQKYKILYVVCDRTKKVLGVAGATPKKGLPIKVMPLISTNLAAFAALIIEIPSLLKIYGRKLYIHLVPNVEQTVLLQLHGWRLDAALPAAYHHAHVTQQWSRDLGEEFAMKTMRVKQIYLDFIAQGKKTLEVRVAYSSMKAMRAGERIQLMSNNKQLIIKINDTRHYKTFDEMFSREDASKIVPGKNTQEVGQVLKEIYPPDKEKLGVVVLDITAESRPSTILAAKA